MGNRKFTQEEIDTAIKMLEDNKQWQEIADKLGRDKDSLRKKMSKMGHKKLNKSYLYDIGTELNGLRIVKQIRVKHGEGTQKGYLVKSLAYPDDKNDYEINEYDLKSGRGCAYVAGVRVCPESSLYSKVEIRKYIVDVEQAKTVPPNHTTPLLFKCSTDGCNKTKEMLSSNLIRKGIMCKNCSKGTPYPELFFMGYNDKKEAGFIPQQRFADFPNHIFDSVNYERRIIVETHGEQHYQESTGYMNHARTVASDERKRKYCKENNWTLIELDCRKSSFEHIRNSIANEPLLEDITDEDVKAILEIIEENKRYPVKEIIRLYTVEMESCENIGKQFGYCGGTISRILERNNVPRRIGAPVGVPSPRRIELPEQEIVKLYESGLSTHKLAEKYGVSRIVIVNLLARNGVTLRPTGTNQYGTTPELPSDDIVKLYNSGLSTYKIAKKYGVSPTPIKRILKDENVEMRKGNSKAS